MADKRISELTDGSPAVAGDDLPVSRTDTVATRKVNAQSVADLKTWANLTGIPATFSPSAHKASHEDGGSDEISVLGLAGLLADAQKVTVRKNTGADVGTRKRLNLIEGTNVTLTIADDAGGDEVDITIAASGAGGAPTDAEYLVGALHGSLSAERLVTDTATAAWDLGIAGQAKVNVPDDAITYAKLQNIAATLRVLGRISAGAGDAEELTRANLLTILTRQVIQITADTTKNASTVLGDVTGAAIVIETSATEIWHFRATLYLTASAANSDFKFGFTVPAGCTMLWQTGRGVFDVAVSGTADALLDQTGVATAGSLNGNSAIILEGWIFGGGTNGNVQLQFAQNTSQANDNKVKKGSLIIAEKVIA